MDKKKELIFILAGAIALLFLIVTRIYLPMLQKNNQLRADFAEVKNKVRGLEQISEERSVLIENKINEVSRQLDDKIPPSGKALNMIEQITGLARQFNLSIGDINRLAPEEKEGYRVSSINISARGTLYDFLGYLEEVEKGPLFISAGNLSINRGSEQEPNNLNIKILFSGYQVTQPLPALASFQDEFVPIEESRQDRILEPIRVAERKIDLFVLKDAELFGKKSIIKPSPDGQEALIPAEPEEKLEISLRGIAQEGDKRVALIDDKLVKEGDEIAGAKVIEISRLRVLLSKNGKEYSLELGK